MILVRSMQNMLMVVEEPSSVNIVAKLYIKYITRLKQHIAHIFGQVKRCPRVPIEMPRSVRQHMSDASKENAQLKKKKQLLSSLNEENFYEIDEDDSDDEIEEVDMTDFEKRQMKQVTKESCRIF